MTDTTVWRDIQPNKALWRLVNVPYSQIRSGWVSDAPDAALQTERTRFDVALAAASEHRERFALKLELGRWSLSAEERDAFQGEVRIAQDKIDAFGKCLSLIDGEFARREKVAEVEAKRERARQRLVELEAAVSA